MILKKKDKKQKQGEKRYNYLFIICRDHSKTHILHDNGSRERGHEGY